MIPSYQRGQIGLYRRPTAGGGGGGYQTETTTWENRILALGGSVTTGEKNIADALVVAMKAESYFSKIVSFYPYIGASIASHRVPLIDTLNVGAGTLGGTTPFTDADCDTTTGLVNTPTEDNAWINTGIRVDLIGASGCGGLGHYSRNMGLGSGVEPIGCYNGAATNRYCLDLRSSFQRFRWGDTTGSQAGPATTASSGHYYGQRNASNVTEIYKDGSALGSNGTSPTPGVGNFVIFVMGCNSAAPTGFKDRAACDYITDGTLTSGNISSFHTLLGTYLIAATGR